MGDLDEDLLVGDRDDAFEGLLFSLDMLLSDFFLDGLDRILGNTIGEVLEATG